MYKQLMTFQQVSRRMLSTTANKQVMNRVPQKQKMFQEDNGIPIHLKGGATDAILYRTTMALTIMGTAYVIYELVNAALPKKK
ncbi:cytochrome c oxidase subunit 7A2, mitochondrial [Clupea harengus]|uniref:Cytochrome c oxidase subunit 7A2, mitochondrial n=1 Tax=Clupea harengus TaxID=7950 RepID=A0A6P3VRI1_CLUHA|nr:cytochrome c oxidase subunit 7A2, mitochondrial [Clupea harengus]